VIGVIVWVIASWGFSVYVSNFGSYDATYGSVGGIIVMLLWMWISSLVLLFGAEVNAVMEQTSGEGTRAGAERREDWERIGTKRGMPSEAARAARSTPRPGSRTPTGDEHPPT
jgi:membrane protein